MTLTVNLSAPDLPVPAADLADLDLPTLGHLLDQGFTTGLQRFSGADRVLGRAVTVRLTGTDSRLVHFVTSIVRSGDFLVVDTGLNAAYAPIGGVMIEAFRLAGVVGIAVDGACTDLEELRSSGVSVFARRSSAITTRNSSAPVEGGINVPVSLGGVAVSPGDLVIGDDNGLLVTDARAVAQVADTVRAWQADEPDRIARLRAGERFVDLGMDEASLAQIRSAAGL